eukprot:5949333-Ditylum_brightwellii.AAC.1
MQYARRCVHTDTAGKYYTYRVSYIVSFGLDTNIVNLHSKNILNKGARRCLQMDTNIPGY